MIVLLDRGVAPRELERVLARAQALGLGGRAIVVGEQRLIHLTSGSTPRARRLLAEPSVRAILPTSGPRVRRKGRRFFPFHALCAGAAALTLLGALIVLAGFLPAGVARALGPGETPPAPVWPWYLAPARGVLALAPDRPAWLGPSLVVGLVVLLFAVPLADRRRGRAPARAPGFVLGAIVLAALVVLALLGSRA